MIRKISKEMKIRPLKSRLFSLMMRRQRCKEFKSLFINSFRTTGELYLQQAEKIKLTTEANYHSLNIYYASLGLNNFISRAV